MKLAFLLEKWKQFQLDVRQFVRTLSVREIALIGTGFNIMLTLFFVWWVFQAPSNFPVGEPIEVEEGMTTSEIIAHLREERVVRFGAALQLFLVFGHRDEFIQANTYLFNERISAPEVARAITRGEHTAPPLKVTIPEGLTGRQMVAVLTQSVPRKVLPPLDVKKFDEHIGFLFPETYYLSWEFTQDDLIELMRTTFNERMAEYQEAIDASPLSLTEIVTLASIVEREAGKDESKRVVAGILLNRIAIDMPLQVDAVFYYLLGRTSAELTRADLAMNSPYNTYTNRGLPPTPIANPGIDSIAAVLDPIESENLYYLTGNDGIFYYAPTHDEHVENKARYLR